VATVATSSRAKPAPAPRPRAAAAPKKPPTKRAPAKKPAATRPKAVSATDPVTLDGPGLLARVPDDAWGGALLVLAGLLALGSWFGLTGPVGRGARDGLSALVGRLHVVVPVVLALVGWPLVHGHSRTVAGRRVLGSSLLLVGGAGLLHVGSGLAAGAPLDELRDAGGLAGVGLGAPLRAALSAWGGGLVLLALVAAGALVVTGTPFAKAVAALRGSARAATTWARSRRKGTAPKPSTQLYDQALDPDPAVKKPRKKKDPAGTTAGKDAAGRPTIAVTVPDPTPTAGTQLSIDLGPGAERSSWKLPQLALLERSKPEVVDTAEVERRGRVLEDALALHGVTTRLVGMTVGPTVTRYELELAPGIKVGKLTALHKDIAYAMAAEDVRIQAPIPGRSAIGIEVPNARRRMVRVGDILGSQEAHIEKHPLTIAMGQDIAGRATLANLATFPHVLIAGQTGAGKSSCINVLLASLLTRATPEQVRLILIDPKRVELGQYNGIPHLLTQVVTNPKKAANALAWAVTEMERRYDLLSEVGMRDVTAYNEAFDRGDLVQEPAYEGHEPTQYHRLPFIVVVIDELADLMMVAARDVEESICRLAQMARAVGIHLVIATQRPSVDVITGLIKANVPSRIAFSVSTSTDSRVVLDQVGAEKLVGKGDMLLLGAASSTPARVQGAWIEAKETAAIVGHWKKQALLVGAEQIVVADTEIVGTDGGGGGLSSMVAGGAVDGDDEQVLDAAMELVVRSQLGSTSMLQRKLRVGFARAGRIMDLLEQKGVVGPSEGSKARAVLMTPEELDDLLAKRNAG
jgi:S-DNA-T family DNA segregation ATPase FtsK/SpoIIIE